MAIRTQVQPGRTQLQPTMSTGMTRNQGQAIPQTGLIGSEQAMTTGLSGAMRALGGSPAASRSRNNTNTIRGVGRPSIRSSPAGPATPIATAYGVNPTQGYQQGGEQAQRMNAALTGALGADAQAEAYAQFQEGPGQAYLREQAERGLTRNAAAIGGLGGGSVRSALQEQAIGMASQDFQNQFDRRNTVADRGLSAANTEAEILMGDDRNRTSTTNAGISAAAGIRASTINASASTSNNARNAQLQRDLAAAGYQFDSGNNFAAGRTNAGNNIANNISQGSSQLANFINGQGTNVGNIYGTGGMQQGSSFTDYANNAGNIRGNAAGNFMGVNGVPANNQNSFGNYGQLLQGIGGGLQAYNQYQQPQNTNNNTGINPNYGAPGASVAYPSYTDNYAKV